MRALRFGWISEQAKPWRAVGTMIGLVVVACDQPPYQPPYIPPETELSPEVTDEVVEETSNCRIQPTLSDLSAQYFSVSCVFGGCHESDSAKGDLDMEAPGLRARLVNVPVHDGKAGPRGKLRVVPGNPEASFFYQKLAGTMARDEGNMMPDGTDEPIDPDCRLRMVKQWISDGALDN